MHLAAIVECASDAIYSLSFDGMITTWNASAQRLFGYSASEMIGSSVAILLPTNSDTHQDTLAADRETLARGGEVPTYEASRRRSDGRSIDISVGVFPISDVNGVVTGIGVIARDISERLALEDHMWRINADLESRMAERTRELAEAHQHLKYRGDVVSAIVDSMSDGLMVLDGAHRIQYCNAPLLAMFELSKSHIINMPIHAMLSDVFSRLHAEGDPLDAVADLLRRVERRPSFEIRLNIGAITDIVLHAFPLVEPRKAIAGMGIIVRDISQERMIDRVKDDLVSVVSHELRTPMASIIGFVELLLNREYTREVRRDMLSIVLDESHQLSGLFNDFLNLNRLESRGNPLLLAVSDPVSIIESAVATFGTDVAHPIRVDVEPHLPPVLADCDLVQQVLMHLLTNACKFSPDGGPIAVSVEARGHFVEFAIADRGLGIPDTAHESIFEKQYRVDLPDRKFIRGTGLGLTLCHRIVSAHGGRIWVESEGPGKGSRMHFTLPIATPNNEKSRCP